MVQRERFLREGSPKFKAHPHAGLRSKHKKSEDRFTQKLVLDICVCRISTNFCKWALSLALNVREIYIVRVHIDPLPSRKE